MPSSINHPPPRDKLLVMWVVPLLKHRQGEQCKRSTLHPSQVSDFWCIRRFSSYVWCTVKVETVEATINGKSCACQRCQNLSQFGRIPWSTWTKTSLGWRRAWWIQVIMSQNQLSLSQVRPLSATNFSWQTGWPFTHSRSVTLTTTPLHVFLVSSCGGKFSRVCHPRRSWRLHLKAGWIIGPLRIASWWCRKSSVTLWWPWYNVPAWPLPKLWSDRTTILQLCHWPTLQYTLSKQFCGRSTRLAGATSCMHSTKPLTLNCGHNTILSISASCKPFSLAVQDLYFGLSLCHPRLVILGWLTHLLTMSISCIVSVCFFPPGWMPTYHFPTFLVLTNNPSKCRPMRSCLGLVNSMYKHFSIISAVPLHSPIILPLSTMSSIISLMFIFIE